MPPRTPLGIINGNRRKSNELTPYQRGKIEGTYNTGSSFVSAGRQIKCHRNTARSTVLLASERLDGHTKKRTGRPNTWDSQFERRVLRFARYNPKITY